MKRTMRVLVGTAVVALPIALASAQGGRLTQVKISPGPQAMPGDYYDLTQRDQLRVPLGPPPGPRPRSAEQRPLPSIPSPGPGAAAAAEAAVATCAADGYVIAVAITDAAGNLRAALGPEGTRENGVYMAMHKAITVTAFKISTLRFREDVAKDPTLMARVTPNMSLLPGGLPIVRNGQFVGAIATSGASAYEEEKCGNAGIQTLLSGQK